MFDFLDALSVLALIVAAFIGFLGTLTALMIFLIESFWYKSTLRKNIGFRLFKYVMAACFILVTFTIVVRALLFCIKWVGDYFGMGAWWYW